MTALIRVALPLALLASRSWALETTTLRGRVTDASTESAVASAIVMAGETVTTAGPDGRFAVELEPGSWVLVVSADGYLDQRVPLLVRGGGEPLPELLVSLFPVGKFEESVEVSAVAPRTIEPTASEVEPERVLRVAGGLDNVFRTLQTLPSITATEDFGSRLSVRGGEPDQNLTMMDGVEVHNPFRLFGLTSAFNPETVDHFELTAGGFGAKYGDRLSSILLVQNRAGRRDQTLSGSTAASFTDANVILEGALPGVSGRGGWLLTGRRTYYDLVANRIVGEDLPSFGDVQAKVDFDVGTSGTFSFFGIRSREDTDFSIDDADEPDEFGTLINDAGNDLVSLAYAARFGARTSSRTTFSWYRNRDAIGVDGQIEDEARRTNAPEDDGAFGRSRILFDRRLSVEDLALRQEFTYLANEDHVIETGFELHRLETGVQFESRGDRNDQEANGSSVRGGAGLPDQLDSKLPSSRVGVWLQDQYALGSRWTLQPGLRIDWAEANQRTTVSPRFAATLQLDAVTRVKGAFGVYTQSPGYEKLIQSNFFVDLSNAAALELHHQRSNHYVIGIEREIRPGLTARVESYYKSFDDTLVGALETERERIRRVSRYDFPAELSDSVPTSPIITSRPSNDARGSAYGLDFYVSRLPRLGDAKLSGWLSYTWSRARRDAYGQRFAFDYDRPHSLNVVGSYRLSRTWTLALTARIASGFPFTRALGVRVAAMEDPDDADRLIPETDAGGRLVYMPDLGDTANLNRARLPVYARFDFRASWRPGGPTGRFETYLELINVLNRDNAIRNENRLEFDPSSTVPRIVEHPSEGFPLLPSFGIRWRF